MESLQLIVALILAVLSYLIFKSFSKKNEKSKLPPGPSPLPIVGNLFQVGKNPHHTFAEMSKRYGPLMSIRLGRVLNVVVSSPELMKEILMKPGFTNRHALQSSRVHNHDKLSLGFIPINSRKWREIRKLSKEQIFANHSLEAGHHLRREKLSQLLDYVAKCCDEGRVVNLRDAVFTTTLNLMSATLFTKQAIEFESDLTDEFKMLVEGVSNVFGAPNVADFFPVLEPLDPQRVKRRAHMIVGKMIRKVRDHIEQRLEERKAKETKKNDFLETLLDVIEGNEFEMSFDDIDHFLLDLFVGGTGTAASSIEWTMTELLLHPNKMAKAKAELRAVIGDKKLIQDSDIPRLPYLHAVIKEMFRIHPPAPLLFPRGAEKVTEISGYLIPKDTRILFNIWEMNRDPSIWPNPELFEPERFLDKNIDYKGLNFPLIPFGAGRRLCPGIPLAHRMMHAAMAALIHNFDWEFAEGERDRNGGVFTGITLSRESPLKAIPKKP